MPKVIKIDYLILGAGPAGLQMGYFLEKAGLQYRIIERDNVAGSFFKKYPRHRKLLSINKVHTGYSDPEINLRWDWNSLLTNEQSARFPEFSSSYFPDADELVQYLNQYAQQHQINIDYNKEVHCIQKQGHFIIQTNENQEYHSHRLIIATGLHKPHIPNIPGIEFAEQYESVPVNPPDFTDQRVIIIGKGNSAFETAENLIATAAQIHIIGPTPLRFAWKTHYVGDLRAVNNNFLDTYQLKSQNGVLDATIEKIVRNKDNTFAVSVVYHRAQESRTTYQYDRVICCTGFQFDNSIFDQSCQPEIDNSKHNQFPAQTPIGESVNIPNLFFSGTLMQQRNPKVATSGFIHGFRFNIAAQANYFLKHYHKRDWPCELISRDADLLSKKIIEKINRSPALWQQNGVFGDFVVFNEENTARYYDAMPCDFMHTCDLTADCPYLEITLNYGKKDFDPFYDKRVSEYDVDNADQSTALHPIIRYYENGQCSAEHHIVENLVGIWDDEALHVKPLCTFLARISHTLLT